MFKHLFLIVILACIVTGTVYAVDYTLGLTEVKLLEKRTFKHELPEPINEFGISFDTIEMRSIRKYRIIINIHGEDYFEGKLRVRGFELDIQQCEVRTISVGETIIEETAYITRINIISWGEPIFYFSVEIEGYTWNEIPVAIGVGGGIMYLVVGFLGWRILIRKPRKLLQSQSISNKNKPVRFQPYIICPVCHTNVRSIETKCPKCELSTNQFENFNYK